MREDDIWHLQCLNFFPELTDQQKQSLDGVAKTLQFKKQNTIYFPGELSNFVYVVQKGNVRLTRQTPRGSFLTLDVLNPGDIFGEMALAGQDIQSDAAEAMTDCTVWAIPRAALQSVVAENPEMALQITKIIGFRRWQIENKLSSLLCTVSVRLARFLLSFAKRYPGQLEKGLHFIDLRLTHQDIAELIGANREIVTATLNRMKQDGLTGTHGQLIVLTDEIKLNEIAYQNGD